MPFSVLLEVLKYSSKASWLWERQLASAIYGRKGQVVHGPRDMCPECPLDKPRCHSGEAEGENPRPFQYSGYITSISFCCVQLFTEYNIKQCYSCCAQKNNTKSLKKVFQPCRRPRPFLYNGLLISLITSFHSYLRRQVCGPSADSNSSSMHCQSVIINIRSTGYLD